MSTTRGVRLCHPGDFDQFFKLKNQLNAKFDGAFGYLTDDFIELTTRVANSSTTVHPGHGFGEPIDANGNFDGCIGHLQTNQSDILFYPSDYPLDAKDIDQGLILFDTILVIGQDYYVNEPVKGGQIFDSLSTTLPVMPLIALFIFVVTVLLELRKALRKYYITDLRKQLKMGRSSKVANYYNFYYVLAHATRYGNIQGRRLFHRLIFLCLSIFSLIVIHIYNSSIKTNLVVIRDPDLWTSYQDLIDERIKPFFIKGMHSDYYFEHSRNGTRKHEVWTYATDKFKINEIIVPASPSTFQQIAVEMMRRKTALIIDLLMVKTVSLAACNFKARKLDAIYSMWKTSPSDDLLERARGFLFHWAIDSSETRIHKGIVFSKFFTGKVASVIRKFLRRSIEGGLQFAKLKHVQTYDIFAFIESTPQGKRDPEKSSFVRDCLSESIITPPASMVSNIEIINMIKLFCVYFFLLALSFVVLFAEKRKLFRFLSK